MKALNGKPPNRRLQLTAFGARDRGFFEVVLCSAPRRQLKRNTLGGHHQAPLTIKAARWYGVERTIARQHHGSKRGRINYR